MVMEGPAQAPIRCNGRQLRRAVDVAATWLQAHAHEVDALNVYPVPDGDTGSNMSQTLRAAVGEAAEDTGAHAGSYTARLAHGALMGARGNSGVILSQLLRGFARVLQDRRTFTPRDLADALAEASAMAYRAVMKPVEGTILTVARVAAQAAGDAAAAGGDFASVLACAVEAARTALAHTREQLPVLKQAGVVDAGGRGYLLILEGALRHLQSKAALPAPEVVSAGQLSARATVAEHAHFEHPYEGSYGYCTEFMVEGIGLREDEVRAHLAPLGDSLLVVGESSLLRVHIHTDDPGRALSYAGGLGRLRGVKIEDMQEQHTEFAGEAPPPPHADAEVALPAAVEDARDALPIGVVAVAGGAGLERIFAELGAAVVPGGQTMNPSTEQLLSAIDACTQQAVIVLPNNKNVVLTARQAAELSPKRVEVLPTETVPQGIAALLAVRFDEGAAAALTAMREAIARVRTVEVTTAVRDADLDGMRVRRGDILGLLDGEPALSGQDFAAVAVDLVARMPADAYEVLTIYPGADASPEHVSALVAVLGERFPALQIETAEGGQPHYQFVISVE